MPKITAFLLLCLFLMAAVLPLPARAEHKSFDDIVNTLQTTKIGKVSFKDEPIEVVVSYLGEASGLNFVVTDKVLEEDLRVTLSLGDGMTVYSVMKVIGKLKGIKFMLDETGVIMALMEDDYSMDKVFLRMYDLSVVEPIQPTDFPGPELGVNPGQSENNYYNEDQEKEAPLSPEEIKDMIIKFTGGKSWEQNEQVKISVRGKMLFVVQTAEVQNEIAKFLQTLQG